MQASHTPIDAPNKVLLTVDLEEAEFAEPIAKAYRTIAGQLNVPGFRRGKAPRAILEAQIGDDTARAQALHDSLPEFAMDAVKELGLDVVEAGKIEIIKGEEGGDVSFSLELELRPEPEIPGYDKLTATLEERPNNDEVIKTMLDNVRAGQATMTEVDRPAKKGDFVTLEIEAEADDQPVPGLNVENYLYEVGSEMRSFGPDFDGRIDGLRKDDEVEFTTTIPPNDDEVEFEIEVKKVEERVLPEVTDEWVKANLGYESEAEMRESFADRLDMEWRVNVNQKMESDLLDQLAELVTEEVPEVLIGQEMRRQASIVDNRLRGQGVSLEQILEATGQSEEEFVTGLRTESEKAVKINLALRSIARLQDIKADEAEIDSFLVDLAGNPKKAARLRKQLEKADQMDDIRWDVRTTKAMRWLADHAEVQDADGKPVDRKLFSLDDESSESADESTSADDNAASTSEALDSKSAESGNKADKSASSSKTKSTKKTTEKETETKN